MPIAPRTPKAEFPLVSRSADRLTAATFLAVSVSRSSLDRFPVELGRRTERKRKRKERGEEKGRGKERET